ncbi:phage-associated protein, HI1409 family [Desulfitobacterium hafniense DP7]|uniref:Phage-associated protein, HI1409 family n=1 Tax=Desulfitobacterium hafniense DP7 TaxID=537010 RepID=G9XHI6_DESHA|nr:DUF1073 domain-containing protein [Desulfitobacterium hafniense]EHL08988.1 phage-associated protein, HI1409 family [Desulfitobacterium hafniense DP7]
MSKKDRHRANAQPRQQPQPPRGITMDAFQNVLARMGYGTPNFIESTSYPMTRLTKDYSLMNSLYRSHWVVRRIIDVIPEDMCKNWYSISSQMRPEFMDRLTKLERQTSVKAKILEGLKWGRLYGGAAAILMIDGHEGALDQPLDYDTIMLGAFKGLLVLDRWSGIYPETQLVTDPSDPEFGLPDMYQITSESIQGTIRVHHSRLLRFIGRELPFWEKQAETYWGASEIEHTFDELKKRDNTSWNIAQLVFLANLRVLKMDDLGQALSLGNEKAQKDLYNVVQAQNWLMNNFGMYLLDNKDDFDTKQYSFSGLSEIYEGFMMDVAGAAEIPVTKLFGRSPAGLNATGESDMQNYYDTIEEKQEAYLRPVLAKLLPVMCVSEFGGIPDDIDIKFNPVRRPSDKEKSDLAGSTTSAVIEAFNAGIVSHKTSLRELRLMSDITGLWSNITDEEIERASDEAEPGGDMPPDLMGPGPNPFYKPSVDDTDSKRTFDAKAYSDNFAVQAISDLHKKLGYDSENPPCLVANAEGDYGKVWAQIWSTGMDWNCYYYMLSSEENKPHLIAIWQEEINKPILQVKSDDIPKQLHGKKEYPKNLWQQTVNKWVSKRDKNKR